MNDLGAAFAEAARLLTSFDPQLVQIVGLSLQVSLTAVAVATLIGLPLGAARHAAAMTLIWDTRFSLVTIVLAGFGRAAAEVGAVMIVGGNIDGVTRVMTTAIALETSKGDLPLALGLGIVLISLIVALNAAASVVRGLAVRRYG